MGSCRRKIVLVLIVIAMHLAVATGNICPGHPTAAEVIDVEPKLVAEDPFGQRYHIENLGDSLPVIHVNGSPYELGRAHGALLKTEIQAMYSKFFEYWPFALARTHFRHFSCFSE